MAVSLQTFSGLVGQAATAVQGACQQTLDLTVGSVIRALLEAQASVALWLQYLVLQVLSIIRLSTSNGASVDSYVADFGLTRLGGTPATGLVVFSCFTPATSSAVIPVGATVRTGSAITYAVYADTTNPAYSATVTSAGGILGGYVRTLGTASVTAPVQATIGGTSGNVAAGVINLLGTAIPFIDTVSNPDAFSEGQDGESDSALKTRFVSYINSRAEGTLGAVENAVTSVQTGLLFEVAENLDASGTSDPGNFVVVVDDGSGSPPMALLTAVYAAVDLVRPIGSSFQVIGPVVLTANVSITTSIAASLTTAAATAIRESIATAVSAYLTGLNVGAPASYSALIRIAYAVDQTDILNLTNVTLTATNTAGSSIGTGTSDIPGALGQVIRPGTIAVL